LRQRFPNKKIVLIHHTSGVTRRLFELESIVDLGIRLKVIDDFELLYSKNINPNSNPTKSYLKYIKLILIWLRIISLSNTDLETKKIRPWTFDIRGHYSYRTIGSEFMRFYISNLKISEFEKNSFMKSLVVHYRLGDLISLTDKSYISPRRIISAIKDVPNLNGLDQLIVYSDSKEVARDLLKSDVDSIISVQFLELSTPEVLRNSILAKHFIGTNSKVSIWIVKFRSFLGLPSIICQDE
jgi:hypothetical protein